MATKIKYEQLKGLPIKTPCRVSTNSNISDINNAPSVIDDVTLSNGDRILVKNQIDKKENGIYVVESNGVWKRDGDLSIDDDLSVNFLIYIKEGTQNNDKLFYLKSDGNLQIGVSDLEFDNIQGIEGPQGNQGEVGDQGPQGEVGNQGEVGDQGPQGNQGFQGEVGDQGPQGNQGFQGEVGDQGPQGFQGEVGDQGPQGFQGEVGDQGPQGFQGEVGDQGPQGTSGTSAKDDYLFTTALGSTIDIANISVIDFEIAPTVNQTYSFDNFERGKTLKLFFLNTGLDLVNITIRGREGTSGSYTNFKMITVFGSRITNGTFALFGGDSVAVEVEPFFASSSYDPIGIILGG